MKKLIPIFLLHFVNGLGFSIFLPVFPFFVADYGQWAVVFWLLITAYSVFQFMAAPFFGALSDAYGRKKLLVISQFWTLISQLIVWTAFLLPGITRGPLALPLRVLLFARIVDWITGWNVSVANAYISDLTEKKDKAKAYSLMGASIWVAMVVWPLIWWFTAASSLGYIGVAVFSTLLSLVTLILIITKLEESLPKKKRHSLSRKEILSKMNLITQWKRCVDNIFLKKLFILQIFLGFVFAAFISTNVWYATDYLGFNKNEVWLMYLAVWVMMVFHQLVIVNPLIKKIWELHSYYLAQLLLWGWLIGYFIEPGIIWFFVLAFFITLGISLWMTTSKSLLASNASEHKHGAVLWLDESFLAWNRAFAPIFAGILFASTGFWAFVVLWFILSLPWIFSKTVRTQRIDQGTKKVETM